MARLSGVGTLANNGTTDIMTAGTGGASVRVRVYNADTAAKAATFKIDGVIQHVETIQPGDDFIFGPENIPATKKLQITTPAITTSVMNYGFTGEDDS